ncbi:Na+/H+ antiporter NhaA [Pigmentiphaga sp. CHJ604]|uniref:Na+/H+ antiporter NhaA n=1 Tax=Pigmentiphaga sp. CHJ604 TaxID=3081984 RepID=UPI0030CDE832
MMNREPDQLPTELVDRFTQQFVRFLGIEAVAGAILLVCIVIALGMANSPFSEKYLAFWEMELGFSVRHADWSRSLQHWINDALMTLFFFVVALELKREMVLGELRTPRLAALPLAGAVGGMVVPVGVYLILSSTGADAQGWGAVMSTDTALVVGALAVLGRRVPEALRLFLLALAIFDDIGAILVVAAKYGTALNWFFLTCAGAGCVLVACATWVGIRSLGFYAVAGLAIWCAFDASGVHATVTGVILGLMTPARSWVSGNRLHAILGRVVAHAPIERGKVDVQGRLDVHRAGIAARESESPIERLEFDLHPWVAFAILPLFALANAGVHFDSADLRGSVIVATFGAFVIGKPVGVLLFSLVAVKMRLALRPADLPWKSIAAGSMLTGVGFTMALFISGLAFPPQVLPSVKLGILVSSAVAMLAGLGALWWIDKGMKLRSTV